MKARITVPNPKRDFQGHLRAATSMLGLVAGLGTFGYFAIGQGQWSLADCFYMSVITISTVGFSEALTGMEDAPWARAWTLVLILFGSGTLLYFVSTLTAFLVEGNLRGILRRNRMQKRIDNLRNHIIVCGAGSTGIHVLEELAQGAIPFVVVDHVIHENPELGPHLDKELLFVHGDATEDDVLRRAGIERARGLVSCLHNNPANLYVTITARALNGDLRIIAKAVDPAAVPKFERAGADSVVSTNFIGAMRMVSELIRPAVVEFLDSMLRNSGENREVEEILLPEHSPLSGKSLREANIRRDTDALIVAVRTLDGRYLYNPGPETVLDAGDVLIILLKTSDLPLLRRRVSG